jgi:beta-lactamase regulating signal transducer with metallopeptidase domain
MDGVLNWLWQGSCVAVACFAMLRILERARANLRYIVCWAALLLILALPALPSFSPTTMPAAGAVPVTRDDAIVSLPDAWWTSTPAILAGWLVWASVYAMRFASAMVALRRARARSREFPSHVESGLAHWSRARHAGRHAALVVSDSISTAGVLGCGRPMIAIAPSLLTSLDASELDRILIHEWAHVQRRDDFAHILQIVIRAVAGWHPAVWLVDRRLQVEREIACDEITVALTGSPKSYAQCLMTLASLRGNARGMTAVPAAITVSGLRTRVTRILSQPSWIAPGPSRTIAVAIVSALGILSAGVGGVRLVKAATFTQPLELPSPPLVGLAPAAIVATAAPSPSKPGTPVKKDRSRRQLPAPAPSRPTAEAPVTPPVRAAEPPSPPALTTAVAETPTATDPGDLPGASMGVPAPPSPPSEVTVEQPRSPWSAAADGGVAIGRKSKQAGVATAGFFTRFARRVAGSF